MYVSAILQLYLLLTLCKTRSSENTVRHRPLLKLESDVEELKEAFKRLSQQMELIREENEVLKEDMHRLQDDKMHMATLDNVTRLQEELRECKENSNEWTRGNGLYPSFDVTRVMRSSSVLPVDVNHTVFDHLLKLMVRRSCASWKNMGFEQNGQYLIDPDGAGVGLPPINVFCDMFTGFTFINHDAENTFSTSNCSGAGCFTRTITYSAPIEQIQALVAASESCQQFIKIDCKGTPLTVRGEHLSWWNGREDNTGNVYWSGSSGNEHICACGHTGGCINPRRQCNCDAQIAGVWVVDQGYLSNKLHLPVIELNLGSPKGLPTQMNVTLGPIRCFGTSSLQTFPESCEDLRSLGVAHTGYHFLGKPENLRLSFCNLDKPKARQPLEEDLQQLPNEENKLNDTVILKFNELANRLKNRVVFSVMKSNSASSRGLIMYDLVLVNIGDGFSEQNSVFIAPSDGVYFFMSVSYKPDSSDARIDIRKNNAVITFAISYTTETHNFIVASAVRELEAGDEISVHFRYGGRLNGGTDGRLSFFGFSL